MIDTESMERSVDGVDYISQLPEEIIHKIIGLLRCNKDAARTSILSKKWRDIWASFSTLVFDQRKFLGRLRGLRSSSEVQTQIQENEEMFEDYVDKTLQRRVEQNNGSVQKFVLHVTYCNSQLTTTIDQWIDLALRNNIKELDLHVPQHMHKCYTLPQCVFAARTITALRVHGCKLGPCIDLKLSNLRKVCLAKLSVNEQMIEKLVHACALLEDFRLVYTTRLKVLKVSNLPKLKRVDLHACAELNEVNLQAPNLETFWYVARSKSRCCKIDLSTCNTLKSLTLEDATLKDKSFQDHLSCFPILEKLVLSKCNALKKIAISNYQLKKLVLRECKQLMEADIDTPNLLSFEYKGEKLMPFTSLNPSSLEEAKLCFEPSWQGESRFHNEDNHAPWFASLQEFLEKFDYSRGLKLVVRCDKNIVIYKKPKEILLPCVYDLKLDVVKSSVTLEDLLDDILQTSRPVTLSSFSTSKSSLPELVHKKLMAREKDSGCCTYNATGNKCWRHFLDNVETEDLVNRKSISEWTAWLKSSKARVNVDCFRLNWKARKGWANV
ncbi:hypothetical protein HRI_002848200 [Hibiscus trionum]|uniref:F-box domain-containing protein n=1 Tax=Hibiscus trionum TaxID=183268 RepID=A0A9W7M8W7_HIBTR|nr:hypothetical protein HRI_002848200 [Hibiscus trionum]